MIKRAVWRVVKESCFASSKGRILGLVAKAYVVRLAFIANQKMVGVKRDVWESISDISKVDLYAITSQPRARCLFELGSLNIEAVELWYYQANFFG